MITTPKHETRVQHSPAIHISPKFTRTSILPWPNRLSSRGFGGRPGNFLEANLFRTPVSIWSFSVAFLTFRYTFLVNRQEAFEWEGKPHKGSKYRLWSFFLNEVHFNVVSLGCHPPIAIVLLFALKAQAPQEAQTQSAFLCLLIVCFFWFSEDTFTRSPNVFLLIGRHHDFSHTESVNRNKTGKKTIICRRARASYPCVVTQA